MWAMRISPDWLNAGAALKALQTSAASAGRPMRARRCMDVSCYVGCQAPSLHKLCLLVSNRFFFVFSSKLPQLPEIQTNHLSEFQTHVLNSDIDSSPQQQGLQHPVVPPIELHGAPCAPRAPPPRGGEGSWLGVGCQSVTNCDHIHFSCQPGLRRSAFTENRGSGPPDTCVQIFSVHLLLNEHEG